MTGTARGASRASAPNHSYSCPQRALLPSKPKSAKTTINRNSESLSEDEDDASKGIKDVVGPATSAELEETKTAAPVYSNADSDESQTMNESRQRARDVEVEVEVDADAVAAVADAINKAGKDAEDGDDDDGDDAWAEESDVPDIEDSDQTSDESVESEVESDEEDEGEDELQSEYETETEKSVEGDSAISEDLKQRFSRLFNQRSTAEQQAKWSATLRDFTCKLCSKQGIKCVANKKNGSTCSMCAKSHRTCERVEAVRKARIMEQMKITSSQYAALLRHYKQRDQHRDKRKSCSARENDVNIAMTDRDQDEDENDEEFRGDETGVADMVEHDGSSRKITEELKEEFYAAYFGKSMVEERRKWIKANQHLTCDTCKARDSECKPNVAPLIPETNAAYAKFSSVKCRKCAAGRKSCSFIETERKPRLMKFFNLTATQYTELREYSMNRRKGVHAKQKTNTVHVDVEAKRKKALQKKGRGSASVLSKETNVDKQKTRQTQQNNVEKENIRSGKPQSGKASMNKLRAGSRAAVGVELTSHSMLKKPASNVREVAKSTKNAESARVFKQPLNDLHNDAKNSRAEFEETSPSSIHSPSTQISMTLNTHSAASGSVQTMAQSKNSSSDDPFNLESVSTGHSFPSFNTHMSTPLYRCTGRSVFDCSVGTPFFGRSNNLIPQNGDFGMLRNEPGTQYPTGLSRTPDATRFQDPFQVGFIDGANNVQHEFVEMHLLKRKFEQHAQQRLSSFDLDGAALFSEASRRLGAMADTALDKYRSDESATASGRSSVIKTNGVYPAAEPPTKKMRSSNPEPVVANRTQVSSGGWTTFSEEHQVALGFRAQVGKVQ